MAIKHYTRQVGKKASDSQFVRWSDKQRYEAVALYKLLGSLKLVSNSTGIPHDTLRKWHISDWWKDYELDIAQAGRASLSGKLTTVREKAMKVVEDRLDNGDFVYNQKEDKVVRKPVNAAVAGKIMNDTIDRSILLEKLNEETKLTVSAEKIADRLLVLAGFFQKGGRGPKPIEGDFTHVNADGNDSGSGSGMLVADANSNAKPISDLDRSGGDRDLRSGIPEVSGSSPADAEVVQSAIPDEREEGLQEGAGLGEHEAQVQTEGPGRAPQGESNRDEGGQSV